MLLTFLSPNATFSTEKWVLMNKIRFSWTYSFNSPNLMIFTKVSFALKGIVKLIVCRNLMIHYLPIVWYCPHVFTWYELPRPASPISLLTQKHKNTNTLFFIWHFLKNNYEHLPWQIFITIAGFNFVCGSISNWLLLCMIEYLQHFRRPQLDY